MPPDRLKEDKVEIIQPASARQNFSRLRKFYANMLGSAKPNDDNISAADLVNCWFIAGVDMDRLKASAWTNRESYLNHKSLLSLLFRDGKIWFTFETILFTVKIKKKRRKIHESSAFDGGNHDLNHQK